MTGASHHYTAIERAFMLAGEGRYPGPGKIKEQLKREGFSTQQITGPALLRQIRQLCRSAQKKL